MLYGDYALYRKLKNLSLQIEYIIKRRLARVLGGIHPLKFDKRLWKRNSNYNCYNLFSNLHSLPGADELMKRHVSRCRKSTTKIVMELSYKMSCAYAQLIKIMDLSPLGVTDHLISIYIQPITRHQGNCRLDWNPLKKN